MSTTSKEEKKETTWTEWGKHNKKPPKIKEYVELLLKYNTTAIDVFKEAKKDLIKQKEEQKNG